MREILFRGKRLATGEWVEGFVYQISDGTAMFIMLKNKHAESYKVDPATVGQFTGLLDKNGKRIFEHDVVEYNNGFDYFKGVVVFEGGAFGIGTDEVIGLSSCCCDNFANLWQLYWDQEVADESELHYCTVIGNIHNPELLEVIPDE